MARKKDEGKTGDETFDIPELDRLIRETPKPEPESAEHAKPSDPKQLAEMLTSRMAEFGTQHAFKPGQMIQWKRGLRNRLRPAYGAPVVVVEVLEQPVYDKSRLKEGAGSAYYREPLTIVAGLLDNDGDLIFFHYDQRRMEPYEA